MIAIIKGKFRRLAICLCLVGAWLSSTPLRAQDEPIEPSGTAEAPEMTAEAERAIEDACIRRFGTLRPRGETPTIRSDNGLVFQSRRFRRACRDYRLGQEFITPYTPEQNGIIERFFRSLKEECTWQHIFRSFGQARRVVRRWIDWYNRGRPHQSLNYLSPTEYRAQQLGQVA